MDEVVYASYTLLNVANEYDIKFDLRDLEQNYASARVRVAKYESPKWI
jgi:hypothetical protein